MKKLMVCGLVALALMAGCAPQSEKDKPVAVVNGKAITQAEFDSRLSEQMARHGSQSAEVDPTKLKDAILNQLITEKLLLEGAAEKNIQVTDAEVNESIDRIRKSYPDEAAYMAQLAKLKVSAEEFRGRVKEQMLIGKFRASLTSQETEEITEDQMKAFYKDSPVPLMTNPRVKMRMVQSNSEEPLRKLEQEIQTKGFDKAVAAIKEGGALVVSKSDWVEPGTFSKATADAVSKANVGNLVGPLQGMGGWYVIRIDDKEESRVETYEEAKEKIKSLIVVQRRQGAEHMWLKKKEGGSKIVRNT